MMQASDIRLHMTCGACPEQYDALDANGREIGYLRLRHGYFYAQAPWGGTVVYEAETFGDGSFEPHERERHLNAAKEAIAAHYRGDAAGAP